MTFSTPTTTKKQTTSGNVVVTDPIDTSSGTGNNAKLILVFKQWFGSFEPALVDSAGNTWQTLTTVDINTARFSRWHYCINPSQSNSHTFTVGDGFTNAYMTAHVLAFPCTGTPQYRSELVTQAVSGSSIQLGPLTNDELFVAGVGWGGQVNGTPSIDSTFSTFDCFQVETQGMAGGTSYKIRSTSGAEQPIVSWSGVQWADAALITFGTAPIPQGTTYYVSKTGDNTTGLSPATGKNTIAAGIALMAEGGDTLLIQNGTYAEALNVLDDLHIPRGFSWAQATTIAAYPGHRVTLQPTTGALTGVIVLGFNPHTGTDVGFVIFDGLTLDAVNCPLGDDIELGDLTHDIIIRNCELMNAEFNGLTIGPDCPNIQLVDSIVHTVGLVEDPGLPGVWGHGAYLAAQGTIVENTTFFDVGGYGIHIYNGYTPPTNTQASNNIVRNCLFYNIGFRTGAAASGILVSRGDNNLVYNNVIHFCSYSGIRVWSASTNTKIYNNTSTNNGWTNLSGGFGITLEDTPTNTTIVNNIFFDNWANTNYAGTFTENHNLTSDPLWVSPVSTNFHLKSTSPARGAGTPLASVFTTDHDGLQRSVWDIGAYSYGATAAVGGGYFEMAVQKKEKQANSTSQTVDFYVADLANAGAGLNGLTASSFTAYSRRGYNGASTAVTLAALAGPTAAWASGGIAEIDGTHAKGRYRFDVPNALLATGVDCVYVDFTGSGFPNPTTVEITLLGYNPQAVPPILVTDSSGRVNLGSINDSSTAATLLSLSAARIGQGTVDTSTLTPTTSRWQSADLAPTTAVGASYVGRLGFFASGALANVAYRVTAYANVAGKGQFTVTLLDGSSVLPSAPANAVQFILV